MNISADLDYAFLGCDGIYDVLENEEINKIIWDTVREYKRTQDLLGTFGKQGVQALSDCLQIAVNNVLKKSLIDGSEDNITAIIVVFRNLLECCDVYEENEVTEESAREETEFNGVVELIL